MEPLDDRRGSLAGRPHGPQVVLGKGGLEPLAAHDQHRGTRRYGVRHQPGRCLCGGHDIGVGGIDSEVAKVLGHARRRAGGVVGHEAEAAAGLPAPGQMADRAGDGCPAGIDDPVQVE
jgi:hypothetical protein